MVRAPEQLTTARLTLLRPRRDDVAPIFQGYASDPEVTRLLGWPRHRSVADSAGFVDWSDEAWSTAPAGPYVVLAGSGELVGSTGLDVEAPWRAATGFVLARSAWGQGYATEIATAMVQLAATLGLARLYALCHPDNRASARVLAKAGFHFEGVLRRHVIFPNLDAERPSDVKCWSSVRS